jgi:hypothetical protein
MSRLLVRTTKEDAMLGGMLKGFMAVLVLAGAVGAKSAVVTPVTQRPSAVSAPAQESPRHRRPPIDEGCRELPAPAPAAPPPVATCS